MLQLKNVAKSFNQTPVLTEIDLSVMPGEIVCLLGPSGCGKTTLLRIVAGLESADQGAIALDGRDLNQIPVHQRNFGLMFQEYALFPHRTVGENIAFGLRMAGQSPRQIEQRVAEMLALVNLPGYARRSIFELSGGERQRVALARSLAPSPRLLMLDEPLGSLDRALRETLMNELRTILKQVGVTALYVTHDQQEAFAVADRIVVMRQGRIEQIGTPQQVYRHPANAAVARFLGFENLLPALVHPANPGQVETAIGVFQIPATTLAAPPSPGNYILLIRAQAIERLHPAAPPSPEINTLVGKLIACSFRGAEYRLSIQVGQEQTAQLLSFNLPSGPEGTDELSSLSVGDPVQITLNPHWMSLL